jgi:alpha-1,2-mannosyltransferase
MTDIGRAFRLLLLALSLLHAGVIAGDLMQKLPEATDLVFAGTSSPVGGDFINKIAAARLVLEGRVAEIYAPEAFMAYQRTIIPHLIGLRLWAYPPTSLLLIWPLGFFTFVPAIVLWSLVGLAVLAWGARRFGFGWLETAIIVFSPAAISSIFYGQTGNVAAGLLLLGLSARRTADGVSIVATALLTIKPQLGLLLPVLWLIQKRFLFIALVIAAIAALGVATILAFGVAPWRQYVSETLPILGQLEREGTGAFLLMIPSAFIAGRIAIGDPTIAGWLHLASAAAVVALVLWRLTRTRVSMQQNAIVLAATALITPYIHIYDLPPLVAAGLLLMRQWKEAPRVAQLLVFFVVLAAWAMPMLTFAVNQAGAPVSPIILLTLLVLVAWPAPPVPNMEGPDK